MDDAGLNPILITNGIPLVKPPKIPPELFVFVIILLSSEIVYSSLFSEPFNLVPENPDPNSMAFTDGMLNNALLEIRFHGREYGLPQSYGQSYGLIHSTIPPRESPFFLASIIMDFIFSAISGSRTSDIICIPI